MGVQLVLGGEPTARGGARTNASQVGAESESDPATKKLEPIRFGPSSEGMWAVGVWQRHYLVAQACGIHTTPTSITR
jgi:hypothetical protein